METSLKIKERGHQGLFKLGLKQRKFCEVYFSNGFHAADAYQKVYKVKRSVAKTDSSRLLSKANIVNYLRELEGHYRVIGYSMGIDKKKILGRLKEMLYAKKRYYGKENEVVKTIDDNATSVKALEILLKIYGDFEQVVPESSVTATKKVNISKMTNLERKEYKEKLLRSL